MDSQKGFTATKDKTLFQLHKNVLRVSGKNPTPFSERVVHKQRGIFFCRMVHKDGCRVPIVLPCELMGESQAEKCPFMADTFRQTLLVSSFFHCAGKLLLKKTKFKRGLIQH